jgi:signal transduction histidine kinase
MIRRSLRLRLLLAATGAISLALAIAGAGLVVLFERHVERRVGAELDTYLSQITARVAFDETGAAFLDGELADPRFEKVHGGLYWQIHDETADRLARSRSLWDSRLDLPADTPPVGAIHVHEIAGPGGTSLLAHERRLIFDAGEGERVLRLAVAVDRADVAALSAGFASDVGLALVMLACVLVFAAWIQVSVGLRPLSALRRALAAVRDRTSDRLELEVPSEIAPLVEEVNNLLEAQERSMQRARDRAADLAHGFKTPLTALIADARRLRDRGEDEIAAEIERTAALMHGHIDRELTRSRLRNARAPAALDPAPVIRGLVNTLRRTPRGETIGFEVAGEPDLEVRVDRDDLSEVLGNLLENAARHARSKVRVRLAANGPEVRFEIDDDGPGIAAAQRKGVLDRGRRLDSSPAGAGLGLAIVCDVLEHYGRRLRLGRSPALGGLQVTFALPGRAARERRSGEG